MTFPVFASGDVLNASDMNAVGLWLVKAESFSAVSSVAVNSCFSSDYASYRVVFYCSRSTTNQVTMRLRVGTTDNTATEYGIQVIRYDNTTLTGAAINQTSFTFNNTTNSDTMSAVFDIHEPNVAVNTLAQGQSTQGIFTTASAASQFFFRHASTNQFTGMNFIASTGTITGYCRVYGYRN
jgi:hypothetical protein